MAFLQNLLDLANQADFTTVDAIKAFINANKPHRFTAINLNLCVYRVAEFPRGTRIDLIDASAVPSFDQVQKLLDDMKDKARMAIVFRLTVWAPANTMSLIPGQVLRIRRVDHLAIWDGFAAQGTADQADLPRPAQQPIAPPVIQQTNPTRTNGLAPP